MNRWSLLKTPPVFIEIGSGSLKILKGEEGLELALERLPNGRLTLACKEHVAASLPVFLGRKSWLPRTRAWCALNARGVTLRRLALPPTARAEVHKLLALQIENEFPLPPEDLAWGYRPLGERPPGSRAKAAPHEFLVVAVKREVVEEYAELLARCGIAPDFTLATLARGFLCPPVRVPYAVLDIGRTHSELVSYEDGSPVAVRILSWGGENLSRSIGERLGVSRDDAEKMKLGHGPTAKGEFQPLIQSAVDTGLEGLAKVIRSQWTGQKLYLTGPSTRSHGLASGLARLLGPGVDCQSLEPLPGKGRSAAILGLKTAEEQDGALPALILQAKLVNGKSRFLQPMPRKMVAWAAGLAVLFLVLPYLQALVLKPFLAHKLAAMKAEGKRLETIDRELSFLEYLQGNQPPYLDSVYLLAKAAPPGTHIDSLSMNRRGELSWRGSFPSPQQVTDYRTKLIDSGFFASVAVEEQTPGPKLVVRMSALWKPTADRKPAKVEPSVAGTARKAEPESSPVTPPAGAVPSPLPAGSPVRTIDLPH